MGMQSLYLMEQGMSSHAFLYSPVSLGLCVSLCIPTQEQRAFWINHLNIFETIKFLIFLCLYLSICRILRPRYHACLHPERWSLSSWKPQMLSDWGKVSIMMSVNDCTNEFSPSLVLRNAVFGCFTFMRHSFSSPSTNFQLVWAMTAGDRSDSLGCRRFFPRLRASCMYF